MQLSNKAFDEVLSITNSQGIGEVGGGHAQKGMEFQKHWAIINMFELHALDEDFLFLFETLQDVAVFNSSTAPTEVDIYQIKKKDRNDWSWNKLTNLNAPPVVSTKPPSNPTNSAPKKTKIPHQIIESPIGKLYRTARSVTNLNARAWFISNMPSDIPLATGGNVATSSACKMDIIDEKYASILSDGLETLHELNEPNPDLSKIIIAKTALPVDEPATFTIGKVYTFLKTNSPRHAEQAGPLLDALISQIAPLGAKTDKCHDFVQLRHQRGYDKNQFKVALANLEEMPDAMSYLEMVMQKLTQEGWSPFQLMAMRTAASSYFRHQVLGLINDEQKEISHASEKIISELDAPSQLVPYFEQANQKLRKLFPLVKEAELLAIFALKAIDKCADLN